MLRNYSPQRTDEMPSTEIEKRLQDLRKYIPFLHRMIDGLSRSEDSSKDGLRDNINSLLGVITTAGQRLRPETLDRCEEVLRKICDRVEREERQVGRERSGGSSRQDQHYPQSRRDVARLSHREPDLDDTPRSPSPEETGHAATPFVPRSIPISDTRSNDNSGPYRGKFHDSGSKVLRHEPVEIPQSRNDIPMNTDTDYRRHGHSHSHRSHAPEHRSSNFEHRRHSSGNRYSATQDTHSPKHHSPYSDIPHQAFRDGNDTERNMTNPVPQRYTSSHDLHERARPSPPLRANQVPNEFDIDMRSRYYNEPRSSHVPSQSPAAPERIVRYRDDSEFHSWDQYRDDSRDSRSRQPYQPAMPSRPEYYEPRRPPLLPFPIPDPYNSSRHNYPPLNPPPIPQMRHQGHPFHSGGYGPAASLQYAPMETKAPRALLPTPVTKPETPAPRREDPRLARRQATAGSAASISTTTAATGTTTAATATTTVASGTTTTVVPAGATCSTATAVPAPLVPRHREPEPQQRAPEVPKSQAPSEEFASPLDSLYETPRNTQTGRGYGLQSFRIPKKKAAEPDIKHEPQSTTTESKVGEMVVRDTKNESSTATTPHVLAADQSLLPSPEPIQTEGRKPEPVTQSQEAVVEELVKEKAEPERESSVETPSSQSAEPAIPLDVIESYLRKALPVEDAEKVLERVRQAEIEKSGKTASAGEETSQTQTDAAPTVVEGPTEKTEVETEEITVKEGISEAQPDMEPSESAPELPPTKRRKAKTTSMAEVRRLQEDLVDFLRNAEDIDSRRTRRSRFEKVEALVNEPVKEAEEVPQNAAPKRPGRKRKLLPAEASTAKEEPPAEDIVSRPLDESIPELKNDEAMEEDIPVEAADAPPLPPKRGKKGRPPKRKRAGRKLVEKGPAEDDIPDSKGDTKSAKKRKTFMPTHLSLRGKKSMYEDSEMIKMEMPDVSEIPAAGEQFFQCKECSFVGEKIIHHYVNEHKGMEIPYVTVPQTRWELVKERPLGPPAKFSFNERIMKDVDWVPSRSSFMNPVACKLCSFSSSQRSELLEHLVSHAFPKGSKFTCTLCDALEETFHDIYDHVAIHTGEFRYRCGYCEYRVARRSGIKHHMTSLHEAQDRQFYHTDQVSSAIDFWVYGYVCNECHFIQMNEDHILRHIESHGSCHSYCKVNVFDFIAGESETTVVGLVKKEDEKRNAVFVDDIDQNLDLQILEKFEDVTRLASTLRTRVPSLASQLTEKLQKEEDPNIVQESRSKVTLRRIGNGVVPPADDFNLPSPGIVKKTAESGTFLNSIISKLCGRLGDVVQKDVEPIEEEEPDDQDDDDLSETLPEASGGDVQLPLVIDLDSTLDEEKTVAVLDPQENGPLFSEEGDSFLKISSVVSLNPPEEVPKSSKVLLSRRECQFPYKSPHDRIQLVNKLKSADSYAAMLIPEKLQRLFKCASYCCSYTSDCSEDFLNHLRCHCRDFDPSSAEVRDFSEAIAGGGKLILPDFFLCPYCPAIGSAADDVVEHLSQQHAVCLFQCSSCFYRAISLKHAQFHIKEKHPDQPETKILSLECSAATRTPMLEQIPLRKVPKYKCSVGNCKFKTIRIDLLETHLTGSHLGIIAVSCFICKRSVDVNQLVNHFDAHGMGLFQCAFCCYGTKDLAALAGHIVLVHPNQNGKLYVRSDGKFQYQLGPQVSPELHGLFQDMEVVYGDSATFKKGHSSEESDDEGESADLVITITETDAEFYGFAEDELLKAREKSQSVLGDYENELEEATVEGAEAETSSKSTETTAEVTAENAGLTGHDLYKCGFSGCSFSAANPPALREHLLVCDVSRDCKTMRCFHCAKPLKHAANLMEHLRIHGIKPFSCGLCGKQGQIAMHVKKHMKASHRVPPTELVTVETGCSDPERQQFILYPKEMHRNGIGISGGGSNKSTFTSNEISNIPARNISSRFLQCGHCAYRTKVRINLILHLKLHAQNEDLSEAVPAETPVNPVPCLERKEKFFDKMTNLASSSHAGGKMGGKMGGASSNSASGQENASCTQFPTLPALIPDNQRYVCGFAGCTYLTVTESMLKNHLTTLHKDATFTCPHCPQSKIQYTEGHFRNHLKLHGPRLYKCGHCMYFHWQQNIMERHLAEKHPNRPPWEHIIREPTEQETARGGSDYVRAATSHPWRCSLCKYTSMTSAEMLFHAKSIHNIKSQFKCGLCPVRFSARADFERHFAVHHPNQEINVLSMYYRKDDAEEAVRHAEGDYVEDNRPFWSRDRTRVRHIRGILLEETELKEEALDVKDEEVIVDRDYGPLGNPSNGMLCCPKCNDYRTIHQRDMRDHLYRELDYKKFGCSLCSFQCVSRCTLLKHLRTHKDLAVAKDALNDTQLENWVDKVVKHQASVLKASADKPSPAKGKKTTATPSKSTPRKSHPVAEIDISLALVKPDISTEVAKEVTKEAAPKTVFSCSHCSYTTESESFFKRHEAFHDMPEVIYCCLSCSFSAALPSLLESHVLASHGDVQSHLCLECGFQSDARKSLLAHFKVTKHKKSNKFEGEKTAVIKEEKPDTEQSAANCDSIQYQCSFCELRGTWLELREHSDLKHAGLLFSPREVGSASPGSPSAAKSVFVVASSTVFVCRWCQMKFLSENDVVRHHATHPGNYPLRYSRLPPKGKEPTSSSDASIITEVRFQCPVCAKKYVSLQAAQNHINEHNHSWKCGQCSQLFDSPTVAMQHFREKHPGVQGTVQSCDANPGIVEKLKQGITLHRVQYRSRAKSNPANTDTQGSREPPAIAEVLLEDEAESQPIPESCSTPLADGSVKTVLESTEAEEFTFYGTRPEPVDYSSIITEMAFGETAPVKITVATLAKVMPLFPKVHLKDCKFQ